MGLKGTRKLITSIVGILAIIGLNLIHLIYGDGSPAIDLSTTILSIIGICGIAGYNVRTQGDIDRREQRGDSLAGLSVALPPFMEGIVDALVGDSDGEDDVKDTGVDTPPDLDRRA